MEKSSQVIKVEEYVYKKKMYQKLWCKKEKEEEEEEEEV